MNPICYLLLLVFSDLLTNQTLAGINPEHLPDFKTILTSPAPDTNLLQTIFKN
jgi:hypothetical protein